MNIQRQIKPKIASRQTRAKYESERYDLLEFLMQAEQGGKELYQIIYSSLLRHNTEETKHTHNLLQKFSQIKLQDPRLEKIYS